MLLLPVPPWMPTAYSSLACKGITMRVDQEPNDYSAILSDSRLAEVFAWISRAFVEDERYADLGDAFSLVFGDLWDEDVDDPQSRALLDEAMAQLPAAEDTPCGAPIALPSRVKSSLGAMGAAQWTGQFRTRPHALLDVRQLDDVDQWVRSLSRGARRTLAKATSPGGGFTVAKQPIRGGEPAPHSSLAHFRAVAEHEARLLATSPDERPEEVLEALATACSRYMWTTRQAGVIREYRDAASGRVIAFSHEMRKGRVIRGQWFYADQQAARRYVWFHAVHSMVSRAIEDPTVDFVDLGPSGSDTFSELKQRYGFVTVADWSRVADYSGPFGFGDDDERPGEKLIGWLAGVLY